MCGWARCLKSPSSPMLRSSGAPSCEEETGILPSPNDSRRAGGGSEPILRGQYARQSHLALSSPCLLLLFRPTSIAGHAGKAHISKVRLARHPRLLTSPLIWTRL